MRLEGEGQLLRIFIGESDTWQGKPLYEAIVRRVREEGLAGATVVRGIEGFGASSHLHTSRILRLSQDLPVVIEVADTKENIDRVLPLLDQMVTEGLLTVERVHVIKYRARPEKVPPVLLVPPRSIGLTQHPDRHRIAAPRRRQPRGHARRYLRAGKRGERR